MSGQIIDVIASNFEQEVLNSELPVLVDFWAPWCGPCKAIAPMIDVVADEYSGKVKVVKINIDEAPDIARNYGVRGIPQLILFESGKEPERAAGVTRTRIYSLLEKFD